MPGVLFPIDRSVEFPPKRRPGNPRPRRLPERIEFRATAADVALLEHYAALTQQKPPAVMRGLMGMLRQQYRELQKAQQGR